MNNAIDDLEQSMQRGASKQTMSDMAVAIGQAVRKEIMSELKGEEPQEETINVTELTDKDSLGSKLLNKLGYKKA